MSNVVQTREQAIAHCKAIVAPYEVRGTSSALALPTSRLDDKAFYARVQAADLLLSALGDTGKVCDRVYWLTRAAVHLSIVSRDSDPDLHNAYALAFAHLRESLYAMVPAALHDRV